MNHQKKILAICGSTKQRSTSRSILEYVSVTFREELSLTIFDSIDKLPHFNPELEQTLPKPVAEFRKQIEDADGILFCSPEYVFSLPGSLKNAIEWNVSTTLFSGKPVAVIIAATVGEKAFESLSLILTTIEAVLSEDSKLLIQGAKGKVTKDGTIKALEVEKGITQVVKSLVQSIEEEEQIPSKYRKV